ncbi:MAG: tryptophan synthase subunit alpha [Betaproteobacteria bacterium]
MSLIQELFIELKRQGKTGLIPFITAGDPSLEDTVLFMHALVRGGADVIELGIPFSDPMADGPVIQRASERALLNGTSLHSCLDMVREFRKSNSKTPVVLMGYANPIEQMGINEFARLASLAGVNGVLVVDYPPEECRELATSLKLHGIDTIFLLAPTSSSERILAVAKIASGYIYYVSLNGVTGSSNINTSDVANAIDHIRKQTNIPIAVGFGISDAASAKIVGQSADAVVIGSRLVKIIEDAPIGGSAKSLEEFLFVIRNALNADIPL